jgi:hypothetical protein
MAEFDGRMAELTADMAEFAAEAVECDVNAAAGPLPAWPWTRQGAECGAQGEWLTEMPALAVLIDFPPIPAIEKGRSDEQPFFFLPSIIRIPSLGNKPAKYLWGWWRVSRCKSGVITLDFGAPT